MVVAVRPGAGVAAGPAGLSVDVVAGEVVGAVIGTRRWAKTVELYGTVLGWWLLLAVGAVAGWCRLQRQWAGVRRAGAVLTGAPGGSGGRGASGRGRRADDGERRAVARPVARPVAAALRWSGGPWRAVRRAPELLLLPGGSAVGWATASPVPVLAALAAVLPARRWRSRRAAAAEARYRSAAVVELCAGLAGELRGGATPEQALHLVTTRIAADRSVLERIGAEPIARLAAGRYGADVPAAFRLLAERPGGSGAAAVAACWEVASAGGSGLAAGLDGVAEALRVERVLAEEIVGELAAPRTTIAVLAALPLAGLLLGAALGARPLEVLLHTSAGLASLVVGAVLEGLGLVWTTRIVGAAAAGAPVAAQGHESGDESSHEPRRGGVDGREEWRCGITRIRARTRSGPARPSGAFRREVLPW
ncbi:type II secretion system F family protein [Kitasatospora sp. NPDC089913]|uniref:type II secretion system F family protein n=1 Tax=Kitasatospora sp. NPDC089913 TaxID=3364080 RepID=UPI0037F2EAFF